MIKKFLLILIFLLILGGVFYYAWFAPHLNGRELVLYGNVDIRQVDLSFRVSGLVQDVFVDEGDLVTPGMLVALLDEQPYLDQVKQAEAEVLSAKASMENAQVLFERRKMLVGTNAVSKEDYDDAEKNRNVAAAAYEAALAHLGVARTNLNDTRAYSPTDGWVLTRVREPGSVVQASNPVLNVSVKSPVWVRAYVNEPNLGRIFPGMRAEVFADTKGQKVYRGHIGFISPVAEFTPKTVETTQLRTDLVYRLRIIIDDPDVFLRQGMPVTVRFPMDGQAELPGI